MLNKLRELLFQTYHQASEDFSGIGVIIYEDSSNIPITHLRNTAPKLSGISLIESLVKISSLASEYHDGFHLITSDWVLTHISQYFSPPIVPNARINRTRQVGGRYVAALYGSTIVGVKMCGVVSKGFGLAIFKNGKEVHFEVMD